MIAETVHTFSSGWKSLNGERALWYLIVLDSHFSSSDVIDWSSHTLFACKGKEKAILLWFARHSKWRKPNGLRFHLASIIDHFEWTFRYWIGRQVTRKAVDG